MMLRKKIIQELNHLLPAYLNGTLTPLQEKVITLWLSKSPEARKSADNLRALQTAVQRQPRRTPPPVVLNRIQHQIQGLQTPSSITTGQPQISSRPALRMPVLLLSIVSLVLVALVMWQALPPGIVLQWSVDGRSPDTFRVYRAPAGSQLEIPDNQFVLLDEVPAGQTQEYSFTDIQLIPGKNYVYRVEGLSSGGQSTASQIVSGRSTDALPGQLSLLMVMAFLLYLMVTIIQQWRPLTTLRI